MPNLEFQQWFERTTGVPLQDVHPLAGEDLVRNADAFLSVVGDRFGADVVAEARARLAIISGNGSGATLPPAVRLQQPSPDEIINGFFEATGLIFSVDYSKNAESKARFVGEATVALASHPTEAAELQRLILVPDEEKRTIAYRRDVHRVFRSLGLLYRVSDGKVTSFQNNKQIGRIIDYADELITTRNEIIATFEKFLQERVQIAGGVGSSHEIVRQLWQSLEEGATDEPVFLSAYREGVLHILEGKNIEGRARGALASVFRNIKLSLELSGDVISLGVLEPKGVDVDRQKNAGPVISPEILEILSMMDPMHLLSLTNDERPSGLMVTRYSEEFGTNIYFSVAPSTGTSGGQLEEVPGDATAIVFWFHGSGTNGAHGGNFFQEMNALVRHNVASISFDYPFHGRGPHDAKFNDTEYFINWVASIVEHYHSRYPGKKIILAGHSFGPSVILETIARFPLLADGAVLLSPAVHFGEGAMAHYREHVLEFLRARKVGTNANGDVWEGVVATGFTFMKIIIPTYFPLEAFVGGNDQWLGDASGLDLLGEHIPQMPIHVVKGMDHYVFGHKVQDLPEDERRRIFGEAGMNPPEKDTRFVVWTVVNTLRKYFGDLVPAAPDKGNRQLDSVRETLLLYEVNPLFRQLFPEREKLLTTEGASSAYTVWSAVRRHISDAIFLKIPDDYPSFYRMHKESVDEVIGLMKSGKNIPGNIKGVRTALLFKLQKYIFEGGERNVAAANEVIQGKAEVVKNYWDEKMHQTLKDAAVDMVESAVQKTGGVFSRVMRSLFTPVDPVSSSEAVEVEKVYLQALRDQINYPARSVLSIGNGFDIMQPFMLLDGTERVVVLSQDPFGSPDSVSSGITAEGLSGLYGKTACADGSHKAGVNSGGEFIGRLVAAFGNYNVHELRYFNINETGHKIYSNGGEDGFVNAEIHFKTLDGKLKILEVVNSDFHAPSENVVRYLLGSGVKAIFAGVATTDFETEPSGLSVYHQLMVDTGIAWITGHRRAGYLKGTMPSYRPVAYLNRDTIEKIDISSTNRRSGRRFAQGHEVVIARADDFLPRWTFGATQEYDQLELNAMRASRDTAAGPGTYLPPRADNKRIITFTPTRIALPFDDGSRNPRQESGSAVYDPASKPEGGQVFSPDGGAFDAVQEEQARRLRNPEGFAESVVPGIVKPMTTPADSPLSKKEQAVPGSAIEVVDRKGLATTVPEAPKDFMDLVRNLPPSVGKLYDPHSEGGGKVQQESPELAEIRHDIAKAVQFASVANSAWAVLQGGAQFVSRNSGVLANGCTALLAEGYVVALSLAIVPLRQFEARRESKDENQY